MEFRTVRGSSKALPAHLGFGSTEAAWHEALKTTGHCATGSFSWPASGSFGSRHDPSNTGAAPAELDPGHFSVLFVASISAAVNFRIAMLRKAPVLSQVAKPSGSFERTSMRVPTS